MFGSKLTELNARIDSLLESFKTDPLRSGEVVNDLEVDPLGTRAYEARLRWAESMIKMSEQYRKNLESAAKLEVMSGQYIHEKQFEELVKMIYQSVEKGILSDSDPQKQLAAIQKSLIDLLENLD